MTSAVAADADLDASLTAATSPDLTWLGTAGTDEEVEIPRIAYALAIITVVYIVIITYAQVD